MMFVEVKKEKREIERKGEKERERQRRRARAISFQIRIAKQSHGASFSWRQLATSVIVVNYLSSLPVSKERWLSYTLYSYSIRVYICFAKCLTCYETKFRNSFREVFLH